MTLPLYNSDWIWALALGVSFGLALEGAGFGSPRKLVAQFTLKDWSVFKVMFLAVVIAAAGLVGLELFEIMPRSFVFVPTGFLGPILAGGALIGAGFAIGGYCPGTAVAGLGSGRLDALVFMVGMIVGIGLFAGGFEWIKDFYLSGKGPVGQTLDTLFNMPPWSIVAVMAVMATLGFIVAKPIEARLGGPLTAKTILAKSKKAD